MFFAFLSTYFAPSIAAAVLALWVALSLDSRRRFGPDLWLADAAATSRPLEAGVVALVPARDEAEMLPLTLPPLLSQRGLSGVVLVDDASTDGTAAVARALAAGCPAVPLEVVTAPERPPGWAGKVHAQSVGMAAALLRWPDAEWFWLTDADIRHGPGSLARLLAQASRGFELVSVMARLRTETAWEKLLIPTFVYFFHLIYPFREVQRGGSRTAAAAGGSVLVRRAALERAGGFQAVRARLIDDVALAKAVAGAGGRPWLGFDGAVESVRPYARLRDLWRMVARSAFVQLEYRWSLVFGVLLGLLLFFVLPPFGLALSVAIATADPEGAAPWLVAAACLAIAWTLQALQLWPAVRHHRLGRIWAWSLPMASFFYALMTLSSALAHGRGRAASWRGRSYGRVDAEG